MDAGKSAYTATTSPVDGADLAYEMDKSTQTLLVVFIAVAAVSILMQAGFTVAIFLGARKAQKKLMALADDVRLHALPAIMSSREVLQDVSPKAENHHREPDRHHRHPAQPRRIRSVDSWET